MPVAGSPLRPRAAPAAAERGATRWATSRWFDAHTHIGHNDPDGSRPTRRSSSRRWTTPASERALVFAMHEPDGYRARQRLRCSRACAASGGRLRGAGAHRPQRRPDAMEEARPLPGGRRARLQAAPAQRRLRAARIRSSSELVALAGEPRLPCSSTPAAGSRTSASPSSSWRASTRARGSILAHAGISDLGLRRRASAELPNMLLRHVVVAGLRPAARSSRPCRPGRSCTRSDMPYGAGLLRRDACSCAARAPVGLGAEALRGIAGEPARARRRPGSRARPRAGAGLRRARRRACSGSSARRLRVDRRADGLPRRRPQRGARAGASRPARRPRATSRQRSLAGESPACARLGLDADRPRARPARAAARARAISRRWPLAGTPSRRS